MIRATIKRYLSAAVALLFYVATLPSLAVPSDVIVKGTNVRLIAGDNTLSVNDAVTAWVDVRAYGAVGDGTTNDSVAIQAAIDAVELAGGGIVFFPPGTYKITTGLTINSSNVVLAGAGKGISKIHAVYTGTTPAVQFIGVAAARIDYAGITGITVYTDSGYGPDYGIQVDYASWFKAYDVEVYFFKKRALDLKTVWTSDFDHIILSLNGINSASTDGVISFTSSSNYGGQCVQLNFSNIIAGSNFGTNIYSVNTTYGNGAINFYNLLMEDDPSVNTSADNNAMIHISNNTSFQITNFNITADTKPVATSRSVFKMTGPGTSRGVHLTNGYITVNDNYAVNLYAVFDYDTAMGELELTNITISDLYNKVPDNRYIKIDIGGGTGKIRMNGVGFFTPKTVDKFFQYTGNLQGTFWHENSDTYVTTYYNLGNWQSAPSASTDAGINGMSAIDASYLYYYYGGAWRRVANDNAW